MSREGKKLQHIHSSVPNKQPKPSILEVGELAVNNAAGNEFISTKNTDDEVVRFSSDKKVVSIIENKTVMPYKGEVLEPTEQDLIDNKSQLLIKLNQVAAKETNKHDAVNGATDMHGDEINPSTDGGKTNGAGFAIDMSRYAMIDANPSFSSVTTNVVYPVADDLFIGSNKELEEGVDMPNIKVYGSDIKLHADGGEGIGITTSDDVNISAVGDGNFNVENNMCIGSGNEMKIGAVEKLTIGEDCSGTETGVVEIKGGEIIINREATSNLSATTVEGALEELAEKVAAAGDGYITGGHVDSSTGIINVEVLEQPDATIDGLEEYINNRLGDISGIAKRSEVTKETIDDADKIVIKFFDKDDNELEDLQIVLDDYYNKGDINDMELVISAALNDLDGRVLDISGSVITLEGDVEELKNRRDNFVTDGEVDEDSGIIYLNMSSSDEPAEVTGLAAYVEGKVSALSGDTNDYVTGGSVNSNTGIINLDVKNQGSYPVSGLAEYVSGKTDGLFSNVEYVSSSETIVFKDKDGDVVGTVDASRFVKDGMVLSVVVDTPTGGTHAGVECLIITWNNDASPEVDPLVTEIPLSKFFDPAVLDDYYTKQEINTMLGEDFIDFSGQNFSSITEVIRSNELVTAAALNDLNDRVIEVSGDVKTNTTRISNLDGRVTVLEGKQDKYVASGSFDSGTVTLTMSDGTIVYITGISTGEGADGNDYVTGGTVNADGTITLNIKGGETATISGLSTYLINNDKYVSGGSVDVNSGAITLKLKNGSDVTLTGLSAYVSAHDTNDYVTGGTVNENTGAITLNTRSGGTASVSGLSNYLAKNDKHVSGGSVNATTGVINLSMSDGSVKTVTGLSEYVSAHDSNDYVTGGSVNSANGNITLNMKSGGTATVTGLNDYVSAHDKYITGGTFNSGTLTLVLSDNSSVQVPGISTGEGADGNDYVSGGSVNQANGNITLGVTNGYVANVTGLSNYIDSKTSGFSTTDIQVNGGSVNASDGVITLTRIDSKNTSATVPSVNVSGLKAFVDNEITINDKYVSGGSINSTDGSIDLRLSNGNTVKVTGLNTYINSLDDDHFLSGGSINQTNGNITLGVSNGNQVTVTGLSNYIDSKTSGFATTDIQVNGGSVNASDGVITLNRIDSKNTSASVSNVTINGLSSYVNSIADDYLPLSGGTMNGTVYFGSTSNYIKMNNDGDIEIDGAEKVNIPNDLFASSFHKDGGTATQVLLANGDVKELSEITPTDVWVNESGDTMTGNLVFNDGEVDTIWLNATNGNISTIGKITAQGSMFSSDKRLKENIHFLENEDLDKVKNVEFKSFNFISNKSSQKIGVIAQELQENGLGKLTSVNDGGYLTVDYISLLCLKIAQLEKEIEDLKKNK